MVFTGCTTEQGRFTILSTHDVEMSRVDLKHAPTQHDVSESDGRAWFLFIPLGTTPTVNNAIDKCLKEGRGDFMTSARVKSTWWTILIFSWESYRVTGDVANSMGDGTGEVVHPDRIPQRTEEKKQQQDRSKTPDDQKQAAPSTNDNGNDNSNGNDNNNGKSND
jgi:hypothetical protein